MVGKGNTSLETCIDFLEPTERWKGRADTTKSSSDLYMSWGMHSYTYRIINRIQEN